MRKSRHSRRSVPRSRLHSITQEHQQCTRELYEMMEQGWEFRHRRDAPLSHGLSWMTIVPAQLADVQSCFAYVLCGWMQGGCFTGVDVLPCVRGRNDESPLPPLICPGKATQHGINTCETPSRGA